MFQQASRPELSAIVSTRSSFDIIRRTVGYLKNQTVLNRIELVIVCASRTALGLDENELSGFWAFQVVEIGLFDAVSICNAAGVRSAKADVVALCEDHCFPDRDWAINLIAAHKGPYAAVGPVLRNANPLTAVSQADFLIGYGPWAEPIEAREPQHLPGHNSSYKRDVLLSYDDRLPEMLEVESVMHWDLRAKGHRLYLDPLVRVAHTNFAKWGIWSKVQFFAGRLFGGMRAHDWPVWKRLFYAVASPLIPLVRFKRIWADARRISSVQRNGIGLILTLWWGLLLDGLGQMIGYLAGPGQTRVAEHEFERERYITDEDRQMLEADAFGAKTDQSPCARRGEAAKG
ncbi:MAG TPA: hypothetical protein VHD56_07245 [Tepidisphaeraceae bacterium]|nr:hypothetical protein [Tepidisphaeraceae bacterium]